jgi:hypothetical protein
MLCILDKMCDENEMLTDVMPISNGETSERSHVIAERIAEF